jgi:hypothetical protein
MWSGARIVEILTMQFSPSYSSHTSPWPQDFPQYSVLKHSHAVLSPQCAGSSFEPVKILDENCRGIQQETRIDTVSLAAATSEMLYGKIFHPEDGVESALKAVLLVSCSGYSFTVKMEMISSSETQGSPRSTRHYNPKDNIIKGHRKRGKF